jgi:hypothetical protein
MIHARQPHAGWGDDHTRKGTSHEPSTNQTADAPRPRGTRTRSGLAPRQTRTIRVTNEPSTVRFHNSKTARDSRSLQNIKTDDLIRQDDRDSRLDERGCCTLRDILKVLTRHLAAALLALLASHAHLLSRHLVGGTRQRDLHAGNSNLALAGLRPDLVDERATIRLVKRRLRPCDEALDL